MISIEKTKLNNPLVSIIVITYNSAKYVLETLESAKAQTYQKIELIISDDASTDNTVEICRNWLNENKKRFVSTELITVEKNTGIPANCNRGVKAAKGEWLKLIAGDDLLKINAIQIIIEKVKDLNEINIVDSQVEVFNGTMTNRIETSRYQNTDFFASNADKQLKQIANNLRKSRIISTVGVFFKYSLWLEVGGFDEDYKLLEDTPMWFKVLNSGNRFEFIDSPTVKYRRHSESVSNRDKKNNIIISKFDENVNNLIWNYAFMHLSLKNKLNETYLRFIFRIIYSLGNKGKLAHLVYWTCIQLQPIRFFNLLTKIQLRRSYSNS